MCRTLVSVGYDSRLFDCDFNQMLEMSIGDWQTYRPGRAWRITPSKLGDHCFACTAGSGSSCGGALGMSVDNVTAPVVILSADPGLGVTARALVSHLIDPEIDVILAAPGQIQITSKRRRVLLVLGVFPRKRLESRSPRLASRSRQGGSRMVCQRWPKP